MTVFVTANDCTEVHRLPDGVDQVVFVVVNEELYERMRDKLQVIARSQFAEFHTVFIIPPLEESNVTLLTGIGRAFGKEVNVHGRGP